MIGAPTCLKYDITWLDVLRCMLLIPLLNLLTLGNTEDSLRNSNMNIFGCNLFAYNWKFPAYSHKGIHPEGLLPLFFSRRGWWK